MAAVVVLEDKYLKPEFRRAQVVSQLEVTQAAWISPTSFHVDNDRQLWVDKNARILPSYKDQISTEGRVLDCLAVRRKPEGLVLQKKRVLFDVDTNFVATPELHEPIVAIVSGDDWYKAKESE